MGFLSGLLSGSAIAMKAGARSTRGTRRTCVKRAATKYCSAPTLLTTAFDWPLAKEVRASAKLSYFSYLRCSPSRYSAPEDCATAASFFPAQIAFRADAAVFDPFVNAGEILQRPAGVKLRHGRKEDGPDIGGLLACLVSFLKGSVRRRL